MTGAIARGRSHEWEAGNGDGRGVWWHRGRPFYRVRGVPRGAAVWFQWGHCGTLSHRRQRKRFRGHIGICQPVPFHSPLLFLSLSLLPHHVSFLLISPHHLASVEPFEACLTSVSIFKFISFHFISLSLIFLSLSLSQSKSPKSNPLGVSLTFSLKPLFNFSASFQSHKTLNSLLNVPSTSLIHFSINSPNSSFLILFS